MDIRTTFADESGPGDNKSIVGGAALIAVLAAPLAALSAVVAYLLFSYGKIHFKVIAGFVAIYGALIAVFGLFDNVLWSFVNSFAHLWRLWDDYSLQGVLSVLFDMTLDQAPLSILIGGLLGAGYAWWRWFRRPSWKEYSFRLTPWQVWKKRRNITDIRRDRATPADGRTLGINAKGERVNQTEYESRAHTIMLGASGSGKTTTMLNGVRDAIKRGEGVIFVDMKGTPEIAERLADYCARYNRRFLHWSTAPSEQGYRGPADRPAHYDPLGRGDPTRKTNLLIAGRDWTGADYYKKIVQGYLQRAFIIAEAVPPEDGVDSFSDIVTLLEPQVLKQRAMKMKDPEDLKRYGRIIAQINLMTEKRMDSQVKSALDSMREQIAILSDSVQGRWLNKDSEGTHDINITQAAYDGTVICFSVDSSNYPENSEILGNFIIQDLQTVSSELRNGEEKALYPLNILIDEFTAIGSDSIVNLINKCRDANMPVTLSTQTRGDLQNVGDAFMNQLSGIVSSFIIHRTNTFEDAKVISELTPKEKRTSFRQAVTHSASVFGGIGRGSGTGEGTVDTVEEHMISPSDIQNLKAGEIFYICKDPMKMEQVQVIMEDKSMQVTLQAKSAASTQKAADEDSSLDIESDDFPKLILKDGEDLGDYMPQQSENHRVSMEEKRKSVARPADLNNIRRILGDDAVKEIRIDSSRTSDEGHDSPEEESGSIYAPEQDQTQVAHHESRQEEAQNQEQAQEERKKTTANVPPRRPGAPAASGSWKSEPAGSTSWKAEAASPGRPRKPAASTPVAPQRPQNTSKAPESPQEENDSSQRPQGLPVMDFDQEYKDVVIPEGFSRH